MGEETTGGERPHNDSLIVPLLITRLSTFTGSQGVKGGQGSAGRHPLLLYAALLYSLSLSLSPSLSILSGIHLHLFLAAVQ
jgi:hypothetical protein